MSQSSPDDSTTARASRPGTPSPRPSHPGLGQSIGRAISALKREQSGDGYWSAEFEADATIASEYVLMMHYMDERDRELEGKIARYLRSKQGPHGGWSLYPGADLDVSGSVKAYYALKLVGDDPGEPHMVRAREAILARGGAARANVFTHITLALFQQIPWRGVPYIPVEVMLAPAWFPFHIHKVSYWSRTVMVPLLILCTYKPRAANPRGVDIRELFTTPPERERSYFPVRSPLNRVFLWLDALGRFLDPMIPGVVRRAAIARAEQWVLERLNGVGGLGAIFPAMVNAHEALAALGYPPDHPHRLMTGAALRGLLVINDEDAYCQPCVSPVWDSGLSCLALQAAEPVTNGAEVQRSLDWLAARQLLEEPGDWQRDRPGLPGGGWAFQFQNAHYPDIDDTPVVAWAMLQSGEPRFRDNIERAAQWLCGMQSRNGGWASFDADNDHYYLNEIPFADHGALLDPPTSDVTARCVTFLAKLDQERFRAVIDAGVGFLGAEQEAAGGWFGRWGTNYVYGTWSVLVALEAVGIPAADPMVERAVAWLERVQRDDGGWGETNHTYFDPDLAGQHCVSTAFQTAWAMLALIAAGRVGSVAVRRGVDYLLGAQVSQGLWWDDDFTAPGFPRIFYLKYHGYTEYFPLWALAEYRNRHAGIAAPAKAPA